MNYLFYLFVRSVDAQSDVLGTIFSNLKLLNDPMDPMSAISSFNSIAKEFAPEENVPGCDGKVRFNGDCVIEEHVNPVYNKCRDNCRWLPGSELCSCLEHVEERWICPDGVKDGEVRDYIVSLKDDELVVEALGDKNPKKIPKSSKVVKMCLSLTVGLTRSKCPSSHPHQDGDRCYNVRTEPPSVALKEFLKSHQDPSLSVYDVRYDCKNTLDKWREHELECTCTWSEKQPPAFRCPRPYSRTDGFGDYYTFQQMQVLKNENIEDFPLKLCHATEYLPIHCFYVNQNSYTGPENHLYITYGEWESNGNSCSRDIWYPPVDPFCINQEADYTLSPSDSVGNIINGIQDACVIHREERARGTCSDPDARFDELQQLCVIREYFKDPEQTCDEFFNYDHAENTDETPIVVKEQEWQTCTVTKYFPANNACLESTCTDSYTLKAEPQCPEGKLLEALSTTTCVVKRVQKGAKGGLLAKIAQTAR